MPSGSPTFPLLFAPVDHLLLVLRIPTFYFELFPNQGISLEHTNSTTGCGTQLTCLVICSRNLPSMELSRCVVLCCVQGDNPFPCRSNRPRKRAGRLRIVPERAALGGCNHNRIICLITRHKTVDGHLQLSIRPQFDLVIGSVGAIEVSWSMSRND